MENLNELRMEISKIVLNNEMPVEVDLLINTTKREIKKLYDDKRILDSNMEGYIESQFNEIKPQLKRIGEEKTSSDLEIINGVVSNIEAKTQELSENAKNFLDEEQQTDGFFIEKSKETIQNTNMQEGSVIATRKIVSLLSDIIEDIRNRGNRRELIKEPNQNDEFNYSISQFKNYINSQTPQELMSVFNNNNRNVLMQVASQFEKYFYMEKNSQQQKANTQTFREELNAGISLEQQKENAKTFMDNQENEQKSNNVRKLPDNVIE